MLAAVADPGVVIEHLRGDVLRHIVALKMLSLHPEHATLNLREEGSTWALAAVFPAVVSDYDRRTYPTAEFVVLIDGNSENVMDHFLDTLPKAEVVLKTGHGKVARQAVERYGGRILRTFVSFTGGQRALKNPCVAEGTELDAELVEALVEFGNDLEFLGEAFRRGARWFAIRSDRKVLSACVVYQNFNPVWEIASVLTQPAWRRQGLAARVVAAAVQYLLARNLQPRYQVDASNTPSVRMAQGLGLTEFLRTDHILMPARAITA